MANQEGVRRSDGLNQTGTIPYASEYLIKKQKEALKAQIKAAESASYQGEKEKQKTEFQRYKQDCRKRALEMAHMESVRQSEIKIPPSTTMEIADKFYKWLIEIPEK